MNVVRLAYAGESAILALVVLDDHEVGDPEGLAEWNGDEWKWLEIRRTWTLGIDRYQGRWVSLEFSGRLQLFDGMNNADSILTGWNGLNDMHIRGSDIYVVGNNGGFLLLSSGSWKAITHSYKNHLYSVSGASGTIFACGSSGLILRYNGSKCDRIDVDCDCDLTSISCAPDGAIYAVGHKGETGFLVDVNEKRTHLLPARLQYIKTIKSTEVYSVDLNGETWVFDRIQATRAAISDQIHATCLSRSEGILAIGGSDAIVLKKGTKFQMIPLKLDASFLERARPM